MKWIIWFSVIVFIASLTALGYGIHVSDWKLAGISSFLLGYIVGQCYVIWAYTK